MLRYDTEFPYLEEIKQARIACLAIIAEVFPSCVSSSSHAALPWDLNACQVLVWKNSHYHRQLLNKYYENITSNIPHLTPCSQIFSSAICSPTRPFAAIKGEGTFETLCAPLRESEGFNQNPGSAPQPCVQREGKAHSFPLSISLPVTSHSQPYCTGAPARSHGKRETDELKSSANKIVTNNSNFLV